MDPLPWSPTILKVCLMGSNFVDLRMGILLWKRFLIMGCFPELKVNGGKMEIYEKRNIGAKESFLGEDSGMKAVE